MILMIALSASAAMAADWSDRPVKAAFETRRPIPDVAACLSEKLSYLANPSVMPSAQGTTRIMFTNFGRTISVVDLTGEEPTRVLLRGVSGKRVRNAVRECL